MIWKDFAVPPLLCPACGYFFDRASNLQKPDSSPEVGDFTICIDCGQLLRFEIGLVVRKTTVEELSANTSRDATLRILAARAFIVRRGPQPSQHGRKN